MKQVLDFDATKGVARQGDVIIFKLPQDINIDKFLEISPVNNRLILLEGEMTGHHHAIDLMERFGPGTDRVNTADRGPFHRNTGLRKTSKTVEDMLSKASETTKAVVKMYSDTNVAKQLLDKNILTRIDLYVGTLVIEGGGDVGVVLGHEEHASIRLTEGCYYVGRQIESAGAEERIVRD